MTDPDATALAQALESKAAANDAICGLPAPDNIVTIRLRDSSDALRAAAARLRALAPREEPPQELVEVPCNECATTGESDDDPTGKCLKCHGSGYYSNRSAALARDAAAPLTPAKEKANDRDR